MTPGPEPSNQPQWLSTVILSREACEPQDAVLAEEIAPAVAITEFAVVVMSLAWWGVVALVYLVVPGETGSGDGERGQPEQ